MRAGPKRGFMAGAKDSDATLKQVAAELEIALALDDNDSDVHRILAALNLTRDDHDKARVPSGAGRSRLNPNYDLVVVPAGRASNLAWAAGGGHRLDQEGDAPQPHIIRERFWSHLRACLLLRRKNTPKPPRPSRGSHGPIIRIMPSSQPHSRTWGNAVAATRATRQRS